MVAKKRNSISSSLDFPTVEAFKLSYLVKMVLTNILQGKNYGVVQTVSLISTSD